MQDPDYDPKQLKAWREFQAALKTAMEKLGALASVTPGGVHDRCIDGLKQADLWSR